MQNDVRPIDANALIADLNAVGILHAMTGDVN